MPSVLSTDENWATVPNYENYEVSNCGHVRHGDKMIQPHVITSKQGRQAFQIGLYKNKKRNFFYVHQLMAYAFNLSKPDDAVEIDHKNRDSLDNRLSNIYWVTKSQNQMNKGLYQNNRSGYRGVCWKKSSNKWVAQYQLSGKKKHIGYFVDPLEGYKAYLTIMIETYGDDCPVETKNDYQHYCN